MSLVYLTYKEIDKLKWDDCIEHAANGLIYGRSFYLDAMAENWDALVLNDYEAVMPLAWKSKWGIRYLYQPAFIQQLGIFFKGNISAICIQSFIELAMQQFKFAEITLNFSNKTEGQNAALQIGQRNNFILQLDRTYDQLYENYDPSFTKSLRRIKKFDLRYETAVNYKETIQLYKQLYTKRLSFFPEKSYLDFDSICTKLFQENNIILRHALSTTGQPLSSVILLKDKNRLYNMISCITAEGKKLEANYFLYDRMLQEFAGTGFLFDFEGSDVKGIAAFYKKFNPENQPYPYIRYNNLPGFVKFFKR